MKILFSDVQNSILEIKPDKRTEVFNFGKDNALPSLVEALVAISVTAKTCTDRVAKAIYGKGFGEIGKAIVNKKGQSLNEVLRISSRKYAPHNNAYLHIRYNALFEIISITPVPVKDVRIGKADDKGYSGKYIVYNNWDKQNGKRIMSEDFAVYDAYNSDHSIIESQIRASYGVKDKNANIVDIIEHYNGQILHIKKDDTLKYALPELMPVMSEALLERNSQTFRSKGANKGFLNTKIVTVKPFKDSKQEADFMSGLKSFQGADNSSDVLVLQANEVTADLSEQLKIDDLTGEYNDKLFEYSDKQAEKNICKAFTVNIILVDPTDSGSLGDSGGKLQEAKLQLWESREEDRNQFEEVFTKLMQNFKKPEKGENEEATQIQGSLTIKNPYEEDEDEKDSKNINKEAQAKLRGTAAGINSIIQLVSEVKAKTLGKEEAVEIIKNIFGFTENKAKKMIGGFDEVEKEQV